jgi:hypothetical protein
VKRKTQISLAISITTIIVIAGFSTLGVLLHPRENTINQNAFVVFFNVEENIENLTAKEFQEITENRNKIDLLLLLENQNVIYSSNLTFVSKTDDYYCLLKNEISKTSIELTITGFQVIIENEKIIDEVLGVAIDIPGMSVDIAPTTFEVLNFSNWESQGNSVSIEDTSNIENVVIFLLDGFGWQFWNNLSKNKYIQLEEEPFLAKPVVTVYPPITNVATATILTGFWPSQNGVFYRQDHVLQKPSIFEIAENNNLRTEFVEGNVGFLGIHADYEHWLLDDDGDGLTDDEIFEEANKSFSEDRSDFIFIHFHGIDDIGHEYGPNSVEWLEKTQEIFNYTNQLISQIPENSLIIITADHGMHNNPSKEEFRIGLHGDCIAEDMLIPFILLRT